MQDCSGDGASLPRRYSCAQRALSRQSQTFAGVHVVCVKHSLAVDVVEEGRKRSSTDRATSVSLVGQLTCYRRHLYNPLKAVITLAASIGKRNALVCRPSARLSHFFLTLIGCAAHSLLLTQRGHNNINFRRSITSTDIHLLHTCHTTVGNCWLFEFSVTISSAIAERPAPRSVSVEMLSYCCTKCRHNAT